MDFTIIFEDGIFELIITGVVDASGYDNILKTLTTHENWVPGSLLIWNLLGLNVNNITTAEIVRIAVDCNHYKDQIGNAKIAKVLSSNLMYGLNRVWDAYVQDEWYANVELFRSREEAVRWLREFQ